MREPVLSGEITREGMLSVLQEIEQHRTTGVLEFEAGELRGEVDLIAGEIALEQRELADGRDPVEALLELREGAYRVYQRLPPLPVSTGDDRRRTGSLAVHVPADLMRYCERSGMTGTLTFEHDGREAEVVYDGGELIAIQVQGAGEEDLHRVFGWDEGSFRIQALSERPPLPVPAPDDSASQPPAGATEPDATGRPAGRADATGQHFLRTVEVALTQIVEEREKRRSPTRSSPPLPKAPPARDSRPGGEERDRPRRSREPTVRVIYLGAAAATGAGPSDTRHVRKDVTAEVMLAEASPERRPGGAPPATRAGEGEAGGGGDDQGRPQTLAGTLAWVLVVLVLMVAALALLARLPPLE